MQKAVSPQGLNRTQGEILSRALRSVDNIYGVVGVTVGVAVSVAVTVGVTVPVGVAVGGTLVAVIVAV